MRQPSRGRATLRHAALGLCTVVICLVGGTRGTQDAAANGDTRTLSLQHMHTKESLTVTFRRDGRYDPRALEQLNWFLRDWRLDEPTKMDPRLFDLAWQVQREVGSSEPIHVVSAYRSPQTNAMLRRRSRAVAEQSQHTRGKAMDFYLPDVGMDRVRAIAMRLQNGGVGYYPNSYNPFVHLDVGSVRSWPRMTRDQLARLFPDGRTVHIPADGRPLEGYEVAKAEILARGGSVAGYTAYAQAEQAAPTRRRSLWASLFGGDDEDTEYYQAQGRNLGNSRSGGSAVAMAYAPSSNSDDAGSRSIFAYDAATAAAPAPTRRTVPERPQVAALAPVQAPAARVAPSTPVPEPTHVASIAPPAAEPSLRWQQGAAAMADAAPSAVPMPPRRPGEIDPVEEAIASASLGTPLPPSRPTAFAAVDTAVAADIGLRGVANAPPAPPAAAPAVEVAAVPVPPSRPQVLARLEPASSAAQAALQAPARSEVAPTAQAAPQAPARAAPAAVPGIAEADRAALRSLFSTAASITSPEAARVALAAPRPQAAPAPAGLPGSSGLALGFNAKPDADLSTSRFSGPAVKPLPVLR